jgi:hypothetical protein
MIDYLQSGDEDFEETAITHDPTLSLYPQHKMEEIVHHWNNGQGWSWSTLSQRYPLLADKKQLYR